MFGGLEIKGGPSSKDEEDVAPAGGSAFGFLNATTATEPAAEPPAPAAPALSSGFSFLNSGSSPTDSEPPASAAPAATSAFSFLQEASAPADAAPAPAPEPASGFDFLIPSPSNDADETAAPVEDVPSEPEPAPSPPSGATGMSAFSFLSASPVPLEESEPQAAAQSAPAVYAPSPTPGDISAPAISSSLPAGAGITFGTAQPKTGVVRKKKSRAQRVGTGATTSAPPLPIATKPAPAPAATQEPESSPKSTAEAAAEAARRAEEFMNQKAVEQARSTTPTAGDTPSYDDDKPPLQPSASNDETFKEAKRAAEEAQKMQKQQQNPKGGKGFMGTFFKGFGGNKEPSAGENSAHSSSGGSVDRLTKKQQDMKRAAAERQIKMQQQQHEDDDDDEVVVSSSVNSYTPAPISVSVPVVQPPSPEAPVVAIKPAAVPKQQRPIVVRELQPAPKKKKTSTQAFEEYQALFAQSVHRAMEQVENVRSQQKMLLEERFVGLAKERLATQQIAQTETQLQVAVEEEDYELADQLGQVLEAHNREKSELAKMLEDIQKALAQLDSQKSLVIQGVASCFDNLKTRLLDLEEQEKSKEGSSDSEQLKQFASISKQLSAEQERLQQDLKHLERDEQRAGEERKELEDAISQQSGQYEKQRDEVKGNLHKVEEEIEELRKLLQEKQSVAAGLRTEMFGLEDSISRVRVKFSRQLNRVDKKERSLQENRMEWETEQNAFLRQKEAHEMQVQSHSEALLAHDVLLKTLESELKLANEFSAVVPTKLGFMEDETQAEPGDEEAEGDLAQLQADVVKCEAAASEAKILVKAAIGVVNKLEKEHSVLISRVPQLEAEKKAAASRRDFKAASKASKEIKDASARLKECEEELVGEAASRKKAAEEELIKADAELAEARKIAHKQEKISGVAKMESLAKKIRQLVNTKKELCGEASSDENSVRGVGAMVLDSQIKALRDEGENLGSKYGGWEALIKGVLTDGTQATTEEEIGCNEVAEDAAADDIPAKEDNNAPSDGMTSEERVAKVRHLIKRLKEVEEDLDAAAEREEYEKAAEYQEVFEQMQLELENMNLTDEESELAFADDISPETPVVTNSASDRTTSVSEENDKAVGVDAATEDKGAPAEGDKTDVEILEGSEETGAEETGAEESPEEDNNETVNEADCEEPVEEKLETQDASDHKESEMAISREEDGHAKEEKVDPPIGNASGLESTEEDAN